MPTLLRIDASSRLVESHTRRLADQFVARWLEAHLGSEVVVRDLVQDPVPPIHADTITGFYTPRVEHSETLRRETAQSDQLIGELCSADELLIDTPMYNSTVPSAWRPGSIKLFVSARLSVFHQRQGSRVWWTEKRSTSSPPRAPNFPHRPCSPWTF